MKVSQEELNELGVKSQEELACLLLKGLYGLKQSGRLWNQLLDKTLLEAGYQRSLTDSCVYFKRDGENIVLIGVYVDDLLITATSDEVLEAAIQKLNVLDVKNLGPASKFLGMRVSQLNESGVALDQEQMIEEMLEKHGLLEANPVQVPVGNEDTDQAEPETPLTNSQEPPNIKSFQSLVGSLLWIARSTRPDIAYAVHRVTRKAHQPSLEDWKKAKKVARYLKGTKELRLVLRNANPVPGMVQVSSYSDADFAGDIKGRKSVSGGILELNGMSIGWLCKKQGAVALSTMEAEYVSAARTAQELFGVKSLLSELGIETSSPMKMYMDNQAAIKQITNEGSSSKSKHIDVKLKFLKDYAQKSVLAPEYVSTNLMKADLLTKSFGGVKIQELRESVGLKLVPDASSL
jgi:hypothetical protein